MPKSTNASLKLTKQELTEFFKTKQTEILQRLEELKTKTEDAAVLNLFEECKKSLQAADVSVMNLEGFLLWLGLMQDQMKKWRFSPAMMNTVNVELSNSISALIVLLEL